MNKLTKEMLISYGVGNVSEDGRVMVNGHYIKNSFLVKRHKFGNDTYYYGVSLTDKNAPKKTYGGKQYPYRRSYPLARVMLAWFNGSIEANQDADHIDGNKLNNHISNLQAISRKENLKKRAETQREITTRYLKLKKLMKEKSKETLAEEIEKFFTEEGEIIK